MNLNIENSIPEIAHGGGGGGPCSTSPVHEFMW